MFRPRAAPATSGDRSRATSGNLSRATSGNLSLRRQLFWLGFAAVPLLAAGLAALWYYHRPQPPPLREALFKGISHEREVRRTPRPMVAHVITIDLRTPSISFFVTPRAAPYGMELRGSTTSQFLVREHVQLAINGDFFLPWWSDGPDSFYPHSGQPVDVLGVGVSGGEAYGRRVAPFSSLVFAPDGAVSIVEITDPAAPFPPARQAISGKQLIVRDGVPTFATRASEQARLRHPRTAAALDRSRNTLFLFTVDGRQPGYSEGATLAELASLVIEHGGDLALNLDGGGSTSVAVDDGEGAARVLNCPIHTRIPWRERFVANHLGVFAERLPDASR